MTLMDIQVVIEIYFKMVQNMLCGKHSHLGGLVSPFSLVCQKQSLWSVKYSHYGQSKIATMISQIQSLDSEMIEDRQIVV